MKKIIDYLELTGMICDNSLNYNIPLNGHPPFTFTREEFNRFTDHILKEAGGEKDEYQIQSFFPTYIIPFSFDEKEYRLVIMYGQGSAWTLCTIKECDEWMERNRLLDIDLNLNDDSD